MLLNHCVDLCNAGRLHSYQSTWPLRNGVVCDKSYENPSCPVYVVEGNGGVPNCAGNCTLQDCGDVQDWCRVSGSECGSYGRIVITDAETLTYEHVWNSDGVISDSFTITHAKHGPFDTAQLEFA